MKNNLEYFNEILSNFKMNQMYNTLEQHCEFKKNKGNCKTKIFELFPRIRISLFQNLNL